MGSQGENNSSGPSDVPRRRVQKPLAWVGAAVLCAVAVAAWFIMQRVTRRRAEPPQWALEQAKAAMKASAKAARDVEPPQDHRKAEAQDAAGTQPKTPMLSVEEAWRTRIKGLDLTTQRGHTEAVQAMMNILEPLPGWDSTYFRNRAAQNELQRLLEVKGELGEYDGFLFEAFFYAYVEGRSSRQLIELLARRCPRYISGRRIEYELTRLDYMESYPDVNPASVLAACYKRGTPEVKRVALEALGSAFKTIRRNTPDDKTFVDRCVAWHIAHKGVSSPADGSVGYHFNLRVNNDYAYEVFHRDRDDFELYRTHTDFDRY